MILAEELQIVLKLLLSAFFGLIIGYTREKLNKPAGIRTHMLVCMGANFITDMALILSPDDPTRMIGQIVTGIGFLGAGTIFKDKNRISGLTTAASLWIVAAIGMGVGAEFYLTSLFLTVITFIVLSLSKTL
jgi:putative Mg2+ transporter-C (MgtC) family protein